MTSQTKNDDDEPPFVLQNCSAMSRHAALSTAKDKRKRGWRLGWFGGVNNNKDSNNSNDERDSSEKNHQKKMETATDSNISLSKLDKSLLPTTGSHFSSPSVKNKKEIKKLSKEKNRKRVDKKATAIASAIPGPKLDKSLLPTKVPNAPLSSVSQPATPIKSELHPPSPRSISLRYPSPDLNASTVGEKSNQQLSKIETAKNSDANGIGGISPDELSRQKRREEIRQKTAWYEEFIRDHLMKHDGSLSSLNKEELIALGLFDKQRRLNRRIRLWGRSELEAEPGLAGEELEQLLVLAELCNQAQSDEAELEMLLVQMENNTEVDMDRLYHLELLSRQRLGEILNEKEVDALQIFEGKKQDKEDLDLLRLKQKDGTEDIDEKRLRELTLLERKRNCDESMTNAELRSAEIIEMRDEDARLNKKDYNKLFRLKEQGIHIDGDRFNLLSLLDRRRNGVEISELEAEILEHYFALREKEYVERFESKIIVENKNEYHKIIASEEQIPEPVVLKRQAEALTEKERQPTETFKNKNKLEDDGEGESSGTFDEKRNEEERNQNWQHEPESIRRQQCKELIEDENVEDRLVNSEEVQDKDETKSASTFDKTDISLSEKQVFEELHPQLKKEGLPLVISFIPYREDDDFDMSIVSFSDETYIKDILLQKESRESDRKEECLEDAYNLYKRVIKKQKLPESEEMLLSMFTKVLQQKNKEMRDADIKFDQLVEGAESMCELRRQDAKKEVIGKMNGGQWETRTPTNEESTKSKFSIASENKKVKSLTEVQEKGNVEAVIDLPINADDDNKEKTNNPQQSTVQGLGMRLLRSTSNCTDGEEFKAFDDESQLSKQSKSAETDPIEHIPGLMKKEEGSGAAKVGEAPTREENILDTIPSGDRRNKGEIKEDKKNIFELKVCEDGDSSAKFGIQSVFDVDGETNAFDDLSSRKNEIAETIAESLEDIPVGKAVKNNLRADEAGVDESHKNDVMATTILQSLRFEITRKEEMIEQEGTVKSQTTISLGDESRNETAGNSLQCLDTTFATDDSSTIKNTVTECGESLNIVDMVAEQEITTEAFTIRESAPADDQNQTRTDYNEPRDKSEHIIQQEIGNFLKTKADGLSRADIDGHEIELDFLYELDLVTRLRNGVRLTEKQDYELDLLQILRQGGTLSEEEIEDFELLRNEREQVMLDDAYLRDLYIRSSCNQLVNDDLLYEVELFHKDLSCKSMSDDEQIELYLLERRLNGEVLTENELEELKFLKNEKLSRLPIDLRSNGTKELTISEGSNRQPAYHAYVRKIERSSSGASSKSTVGPQSIGRREALIDGDDDDDNDDNDNDDDDDDDVYRHDLVGRQMAGKRLDKKEFQWLQILMKKSRNEELDEHDLDELKIMRNQRNEKEVDFVNTKKLLEQELKRQNKDRMKKQRRKEKEERRDQRRKEKLEREKLKKRRKRTKSIIRSEAGAMHNVQAGSDEMIDATNLQHAKIEVQIIGAPLVQPPRPEEGKKEEPKIGVFGAVFKNAKKQRQEQQLEEAKRQQEELIKKQMKALALENEVEELEREKVMQEQLVQETIEKKRAASVIGSSFASSIGSSSWDTNSAEMSCGEENDGSSWTSCDTSSDEDSSQSKEMNTTQQNESGEKVDHGASVNSTEFSQLIMNEVESQLSDVEGNVTDSSQVQNFANRELLYTSTNNESDQIPPTHSDRFQGEHISNHSAELGKAESSEERWPRSEIKGEPKRSSLGFHLKKRKKKRTKHGDDVSLGTLKLSKTSKEGRNSQNIMDKASKSKDRPWIVNNTINSTINNDHPGTAQHGDGDNRNEKSVSESSSFDFNPSFISRISESDDEDEEESFSFVHSGTEGERDVETEEKDSSFEAQQSLMESLANSFTSIGEEAYDLGLEEYDNIESRLGGKVKDKQAEFDLTWETAVADENVIIQINQRLRERQRVLEVKREKKKEKKERKNLKEVPRLFLFEGERIVKNGAKRSNNKKLQNKLNRTLTKEFRKAMKEVFDSKSDSDDDGYHRETNENRRTSNDDLKKNSDIIIPPFSSKEVDFVDDASDPFIYSNNDEEFAEESTNNSDDESVNFDGEYLKKLQARSLPADLKKMLSGRSLVTSSRNFMSSKRMINKVDSSDDDSFTSDIEKGYGKGLRRPRRKKTGEIVNPNIDPAEVYTQELVKQNEKKTFTIAGIRKDMEDMKSKNFTDESNENFGNFDAINPSSLIQSENIVKKTKKKNVSLGRGVESLERQRPKPARSMRSLGTTFSDQGLLTGNRRGRRNSPNGLARTQTIKEDDKEEEEVGILRTSKISSYSFEVNDFDNEKSGTTGGSSKLPNIKLFGAIKKTFKTKKPTEVENADDGGLLNGAQNDEFDTSESKGGNTDESFQNPSAFRQQEPLPLPVEEDEIIHQRGNKMFERVKIKGVLSKLKKLPGKSSHNRKFGGGIMMAD